MDIRCSVFSNTLDHLGNKDFRTLQLSSSTKTVESTNFTEHGMAVNNKCITWNFFLFSLRNLTGREHSINIQKFP